MNDKVQKEIKTNICIVGGGPGGAFLGLLLAKAGIDVVLLERAKDFNRDFRGESLSPDALQMLQDHGLEDFICEHGYLESKALNLFDNGDSLMRFEFSKFNYKNKYVIEFPQPMLLKGITDKANEYDNFTLMMKTSCKELIEENGKICGIIASDENNNAIKITADLVVAADGRYSKLRKLAKLHADIKKSERDILWLKIPRPAEWPEEVRIKLKGDKHLIILPTFPNHLRLGINIPAGGYRNVRNKEIEYLHDFIIDLEPGIAKEVRENVKDWKSVALLDIFTAKVPKWSIDGMTLLGDAAHTITPVMGQGIKHAIFDAKKLFEVIQDCLNKNPDEMITSQQLEIYQNERKVETDFILKIQERQEKIFGFSQLSLQNQTNKVSFINVWILW